MFIETDDKSSQQLFPVVDEGGNIEPIISASSASDFVRALWAYYLSLLVKGTRHPGFLVMDEPAQQAVKEEDFKTMLDFASMFEDCSLLKRKGFCEVFRACK